MSVLVTGSAGRIGSAIVHQLQRDGTDVVGVDIRPSPTTEVILKQDDYRPLERIVNNASSIIHCAALHAPHVGVASDAQFWQTNVDLTQQLISMCPASARFVFTSSTSVYGHSLEGNNRRAVWVDEQLSTSPRDIYDETKLAAEQLLAQAAHKFSSATVLRVARCFPEPQRDMALYRLYRGVALSDVVNAHKLALRVNHDFDCFNIAGPMVFDRVDLEDLGNDPWSCILRYYPMLESEFAKRGWASPSRIDRVYSSAKAIERLGYRPKCDVLTFLQQC